MASELLPGSTVDPASRVEDQPKDSDTAPGGSQARAQTGRWGLGRIAAAVSLGGLLLLAGLLGYLARSDKTGTDLAAVTDTGTGTSTPVHVADASSPALTTLIPNDAALVVRSAPPAPTFVEPAPPKRQKHRDNVAAIEDHASQTIVQQRRDKAVAIEDHTTHAKVHELTAASAVLGEFKNYKRKTTQGRTIYSDVPRIFVTFGRPRTGWEPKKVIDVLNEAYAEFAQMDMKMSYVQDVEHRRVMGGVVEALRKQTLQETNRLDKLDDLKTKGNPHLYVPNVTALGFWIEIAAYSMQRLMMEGSLRVERMEFAENDHNGTSVSIAIGNTSDHKVEFVIPQGTVFQMAKPEDMGHQNMATRSEMSVSLSPGESRTLQLDVHCVGGSIPPPPAGEPAIITPLRFMGDSHRFDPSDFDPDIVRQLPAAR
jgi:hypothetical protein